MRELAEAIDRPWNPLAVDRKTYGSPRRLPARTDVDSTERIAVLRYLLPLEVNGFADLEVGTLSADLDRFPAGKRRMIERPEIAEVHPASGGGVRRFDDAPTFFTVPDGDDTLTRHPRIV